MSGPLDLTAVIPAHNEGPNLRLLLPQLQSVLDRLAVRSEILVVVREEDAETREAADGRATVLCQSQPGYGGALRAGFARAQGTHVLTMDADSVSSAHLRRRSLGGARRGRGTDRLPLRRRGRRADGGVAGDPEPGAQPLLRLRARGAVARPLQWVSPLPQECPGHGGRGRPGLRRPPGDRDPGLHERVAGPGGPVPVRAAGPRLVQRAGHPLRTGLPPHLPPPVGYAQRRAGRGLRGPSLRQPARSPALLATHTAPAHQEPPRGGEESPGRGLWVEPLAGHLAAGERGPRPADGQAAALPALRTEPRPGRCAWVAFWRRSLRRRRRFPGRGGGPPRRARPQPRWCASCARVAG